MSRLTNTDMVCRKHVDELAGSDRRAVAIDLARQARNIEYQDRDRASAASRALMRSIQDEAGENSLSRKDANALVAKIKKHVRSAYEWKGYAIAYRRYADELAQQR